MSGIDFNVALRLKYEQRCLDCGESDFVEDHAQGDLICRVRMRPYSFFQYISYFGGKV